jgi:hypothetical protein
MRSNTAVVGKQGLIMEFLKVIFWEYLQNLPLIAGFCWAFDLWQEDRFWAAISCIAVGGVAGAVLIALTESRKQAGYQEPRAVLLANIVSFSIIMFVMVVYLTARWSSWLTDLAIGALVGIGIGIVQSLAAKKKINIVHCIALGITSPLVLIGIRWSLNIGWSIWVNILLMCLLATLIISLIDYAPDKFNLI